jgi:hypothetical protein
MLAMKQQMKHIARQLDELLQQSKKLQAAPGPQQHPTATGASHSSVGNATLVVSEHVYV